MKVGIFVSGSFCCLQYILGDIMDIIIVGCGKVGTALAVRLEKEGNRVTVIDIDDAKVNSVANASNVMGLTGNGAVHSVQVEAGIQSADLLIAVTGSDELNILCCITARKVGSCRTIARVRDPEYSAETSFLQSELGLAMTINPELTAAREIARILQFPSAMKIDTFADGKVELLKFKLPDNCRLEGMAIKEMTSALRSNVLVCIIERGDTAIIPNGDFVFCRSDIVSIVATHSSAKEFFKKINYRMNSVKDVMIAGCGEIGFYLTNILKRSGVSVKIIEKDKARCEKLSIALDNTVIINDDATSKDMLLEEGIEDMGGIVALTNMDEENILLSLFAIDSSKGKAKVITKVNRLDFDDVIKRLPLDSIVYPKNLTTDMIIRYIRAMQNTIGSNVETLYNVFRDQIEAAEFRIAPGSPITDQELSKLRFKEHTLIAAILRRNKVIIPRGEDMIKAGDSVVVVTDLKKITDISDILVK